MRRPLSILPLFVAMSLITALAACSPFGNVAWSEARSIRSQCWSQDDRLEFVPLFGDSNLPGSRLFDLEIGVRHTERFRYDSIRMTVDYESYSAPPRTDTVALALSDVSGRWTGSGRRGLYEKSAVIRSGFRLPEGFRITIAPLAPQPCLEGVDAVVLTLRKR